MQVPWLPELFQQSGDYAFLDTCFLKKPFGVTSGEMTHEDLEAYKYTFGREYKICQPTSEDIKHHFIIFAMVCEPVWPSGKALGW